MENKPSLHQQANAFLFQKAKQLRRKKTPAENALWGRLQARSLLNFKFRQQHPIGQYIADFYCHSLKLVIEVDGGYHFSEEQQLKDKIRDEKMIEHDLHVLRLTNEEVLENIQGALDKIIAKIEEIEAG